GLPWTWPESSGTLLDDLVALLRAPRPEDAPATWPDDAPTLISVPRISHSREWQTPPGRASGALSSALLGQMPNALRGAWARQRAQALAEVEPPRSGISSSRWNIHEDDAERATDKQPSVGRAEAPRASG
nr:hypothetical protein [Ktedonobacterales bacterium]